MTSASRIVSSGIEDADPMRSMSGDASSPGRDRDLGPHFFKRSVGSRYPDMGDVTDNGDMEPFDGTFSMGWSLGPRGPVWLLVRDVSGIDDGLFATRARVGAPAALWRMSLTWDHGLQIFWHVS
jgi:hypothetical protein